MSKKEVHDALFSIANDKSPGMDVYNVEFFKTHWSTVGPDVTEAVQLFFTTEHLLKEWNRTLIILLPKIRPPEEVQHLHPISLCNVLYKCTGKCMVNITKKLFAILNCRFSKCICSGSTNGG